MNLIRITSSLLATALASLTSLPAQSCAGLEHHGSLPGGATVEGVVQVPAGCQGQITIRGDQQASIQVLLLDACGRVLAQRVTDSGGVTGHLQIPTDVDGARLVLRNLGDGSTSFVVQIW